MSINEKKQIQFNSEGQPIDPGAAKFSTFVGQMARLHCSPTYSGWHDVPDTSKGELWKAVQNEYNISLDRKVYVLLKANIAWKSWKYILRKHYDKYSTNDARLLNLPKKIRPEDWANFISICSTADDREKRDKAKSSRKCMKLPHTSGRRGAARTKEQLKKQSVDGKVTRTQLFVATHTRSDGSCPFPEARPTLEEIKRLISIDPLMGENDLNHDPVAEVCGPDGNGRVLGMGSGVSKTTIIAAAPYKEIAEREKRERENVEQNFRVIMQRLDEESTARKILEEKLLSLVENPSATGNTSQGRQNSPEDIAADTYTPPSSTRCLLKSFKKKTVALGDVLIDAPQSADSYDIRIRDIFDHAAQLYKGEGTFEIVSLSGVITWPKHYVEFV